MFKVTELNTFPVKSLGGFSSDSARLTPTGFEYDRRWMLTDRQGNFLTQREAHEMALLVATISDGTLQIRHKNNQATSVALPLLPESNDLLPVTIWSDRCSALRVSKLADDWFSDFLKIDCQLVYMPETTKRLVDGRYAKNRETTSFTDGYPTLMIGAASLADLNSRIIDPLPMNRFRPNIVFEGGDPYEEDFFEHFKIGSVDFEGVKRCGRCVITTIDQETLEMGDEPLRTFAGYRAQNNKIYFGRYLVHKGNGTINTGDQIVFSHNNKLSGV